MPAAIQNPSSVVRVFATLQQQSGSGAVAMETVHSGTSLHQCWYSENVLIGQLFFGTSLPVPALLLTRVPGAVCARTAVLYIGAVSPAMVLRGPEHRVEGRQLAGRAVPSLASLHSLSHLEFPKSFSKLLIFVNNLVRGSRLLGAGRSLLFYRS